jgi:hypothetical protein
MQFLIEVYDQETECIAKEICFEVASDTELLPMIGLEEFHPQATYELDGRDIQRINGHFNLNIDENAPLVKIRQKMALDDLPYQIHTNRELALMLAGKKPLSAFVGTHPHCADIEEIPERLFDKHVSSGRFIKKECIEPLQEGLAAMIRRVFYALPEESWRINAYILLFQTARRAGWSEGFERMEGSLLGYTDQQNDAYLEFINKRKQQSESRN